MKDWWRFVLFPVCKMIFPCFSVRECDMRLLEDKERHSFFHTILLLVKSIALTP